MKRVNLIKYLKENKIDEYYLFCDIFYEIEDRKCFLEDKTCCTSGSTYEMWQDKLDCIEYIFDDMCDIVERLDNEERDVFTEDEIIKVENIRKDILKYQEEYGGLYRITLYI